MRFLCANQPNPTSNSAAAEREKERERDEEGENEVPACESLTAFHEGEQIKRAKKLSLLKTVKDFHIPLLPFLCVILLHCDARFLLVLLTVRLESHLSLKREETPS